METRHVLPLENVPHVDGIKNTNLAIAEGMDAGLCRQVVLGEEVLGSRHGLQ